MRTIVRMILGLILLMPVAHAPSAQAAARISPYLEVQQVIDADLGDGGDVLTYTTLAAGVDGSVTTRRVEAQVSYRYERRIPWNDRLSDDNVHSGLARVRLEVAPEILSMEGGAIAIRTRSDIRGDAPGLFTADSSNVTQVYGLYAGPSLRAHVGRLAVTADYRVGYVMAESDNDLAVLPGGQPVLDRYDDATSHDAVVSVGMPTGSLPFGWTLTGGGTREDASQLDQRYIGKYVRGDILWPVSPTLALTGGIGYENIRISERAALLDAGGFPLFDRRGRFITDPASPRILSYQTDGLLWDVGVIWKPNRRTTLQARGGERYGDYAITATLDYRFGRRSALRIGVFDAIDSFGRALTRNLANLPTRFNLDRNPLTGDLGGCVFGNEPGTGSCFNDALQSVTTSNYRTRGGYAMLTHQRGPWTLTAGGGYVAHRFLAPRTTGGFTVDGLTDESVMIEATAQRRLSAASGISGTLFGQWYSSGISGSADVTDYGAAVSYYRNFTDHLIGHAGVGLYGSHISGAGSETDGQLVVGLRYAF